MEQEVRELLEARYADKRATLEQIRARWKNLPDVDPEQMDDWRNERRS